MPAEGTALAIILSAVVSISTVFISKGFEARTQRQARKADLEQTKDQSEFALIKTLVDSQTELLKQQVAIQNGTFKAIVKLEQAVNNLSDAVEKSFEVNDRRFERIESELQALKSRHISQ